MPTYRTSILVTVETKEPVKARAVAKLARLKLGGQEIYTGTDKNRTSVKVTKVTVQHGSER